MSFSRLVRIPVLSLASLTLIVAISSCSKKEVVQDEPLINPSGADAGAAVPGSGDVGATAVPDEGANAGLSAGDGELQVAFFDFDSYRINGQARTALTANAQWLKSNPNATAQIEGHCDERGTTEYNLALGERRANAARDFLVNQGVAKSRLSVISYGEERPADPGHDEAAWSRNRRASFVVLSR